VGAPDIKRPVRRSMWWLRAHFLCRTLASAASQLKPGEPESLKSSNNNSLKILSFS
jgi:hypothetical protein